MIWPTIKLGECVSVQNGYAFKSEEYSDSGHFVMRITNVQQGYISNNNPKYVDIKNDSKIKQFILEDGDILMSLTGDVGRVGVITKSHLPAVLNQRVAKLKIKSEKIDKNYLFWFLNSENTRVKIESCGNGAAQINVSSKQIELLDVPLPPITEQQRLAAIFNYAEQVKQKREVAINKLSQLKKSIFQKIISENDFERIKLGDVCHLVRGPFGGSLKKEFFVQDGYAVYEQQHAIYNKFNQVRYFVDESKFNELKRFELKSGDLIMSCSGTMGKVAIAPEGLKKGLINQALLKLTPKPNLNVFFLKEFMESELFQTALNNETHGAAIKNVASVAILKNLNFQLPSIKVQNLIADATLKIDNLLKANNLNASLESKLSLSLQSKAFSN